MTETYNLPSGSQRGHLRLIYVYTAHGSDMLKEVWLDPRRIVSVESHRNPLRCYVTVRGAELEMLLVNDSIGKTMEALGLVPPSVTKCVTPGCPTNVNPNINPWCADHAQGPKL